MANVERLREVRATALANPEKWDQTAWARATECGTQMCFAGWACHLAGREFSWALGRNETLESYIARWDFLGTGTLVPTEAENASAAGQAYVHVQAFAEKWLDLTPDEANALFMSTDNDEALEVMDTLIEKHSA